MSKLLAAATKNAAAASGFPNPNADPFFPIMQTPHFSEECGKSAHVERALQSTFNRVQEICENKAEILAARVKAEQRINPRTKDFKENFNLGDVERMVERYDKKPDKSIRVDLQERFSGWWEERHLVVRGIVQEKQLRTTEAQKRNNNKSSEDQQPPVDYSWLYHKQCLCWEFLKVWLDDQNDKTTSKTELMNDDRYRRAQYLTSSADTALGVLMSVELFD
ncbi:MAG: hypothetical protein Q9224_004298 [Gallowayella concinna]